MGVGSHVLGVAQDASARSFPESGEVPGQVPPAGSLFIGQLQRATGYLVSRTDSYLLEWLEHDYAPEFWCHWE